MSFDSFSRIDECETEANNMYENYLENNFNISPKQRKLHFELQTDSSRRKLKPSSNDNDISSIGTISHKSRSNKVESKSLKERQKNIQNKLDQLVQAFRSTK
jgi:hypothetical protein